MANWWRAAASSLRSPNNRLIHTIEAVPREASGPRSSVRERRQGRIPAVVYAQKLTQRNPDDPTSISASISDTRKFLLTTEKKHIKSILDSIQLPFFGSTTFPFQIRAGSGSSTLIESGKVLPTQIHRDKKSGEILSLTFVWAEDGTSLKVDVPIVFKGEGTCPGIKKGGVLMKSRRCLKFLCPAESIPLKIEVDVSNLDIGDEIHIKDITVDSTLKLLSKYDSIRPICRIRSKVIKSDEAATEIKDHEAAE